MYIEKRDRKAARQVIADLDRRRTVIGRALAILCVGDETRLARPLGRFSWGIKSAVDALNESLEQSEADDARHDYPEGTVERGRSAEVFERVDLMETDDESIAAAVDALDGAEIDDSTPEYDVDPDFNDAGRTCLHSYCQAWTHDPSGYCEGHMEMSDPCARAGLI